MSWQKKKYSLGNATFRSNHPAGTENDNPTRRAI